MNNPDFVSFAGLLVLLTLLTGLIWAGWALFAHRGHGEDVTLKQPWLVGLARSLFPVVLIVLLLRSFVVEPFRIPSGSMIPTLQVGDFILVNKFAYGLRLPVINTRILSTGKPKRGDVVVFRFPRNPHVDFIKRIIGLPGDTIRYENKQIYINGKPVPRKKLGVYTGEDASLMPYSVQYKENLRGVKHDILHIPARPSQPPQRYKVPKGEYFVMGDNRDNSDDSRSWGFVPTQNLVGKAMVIWMSWDTRAGGPAFGRIGKVFH
jgi:signal peptidase I